MGGPVVRNRTFFFGSYQRTRARTSFVDEASNTVLVPAALTDDRSNAGINAFAQAIWDTSANGPINLGAINAISRLLLQARFPDGSFMVPSGALASTVRRATTRWRRAVRCCRSSRQPTSRINTP